jgi:hypothetical protein
MGWLRGRMNPPPRFGLSIMNTFLQRGEERPTSTLDMRSVYVPSSP